MGIGLPAVLQQILSVPTLDAVPVANASTEGLGVPPAIDRRDITPQPSELSVEVVGWGGPMTLPPVMAAEQTLARDWIEYWELKGLGVNVAAPAPRTPGIAAATPLFQEDDDVGWISDVYETVDASLGGILPGGAPLSVGGVPTSIVNQPLGLPAPTVTAMPGTPAAVPSPTIKQYCYKFRDGQWQLVKMRRRRRKQLATKGDLKDLAALKGILGTGKAFEVWIATHS